MKTIFYVAGKSGGHIVPALTLAQQQHKHEATVCGIFSTTGALDAQLIGNCSAITEHIPLPLSGLSKKHPLFFVQLLQAWYISFMALRRIRPAAVISTGGLVSVPVCIAAWMLRIPYDLYEFNVEPGAAVKFLASRARTVYACFAATQRYIQRSVQYAPYPVRYTDADRITPSEARSTLGLAADKKTLMIIGGSQGSRFINTLLQQWVEQLSADERAHVQIIHQAGLHDVAALQEVYRTAQIEAIVFAYRDDIALCYQASDYLITRAGAGVLHELLFFNKRALIIPLEIASTHHQVTNAQAFVERDPASWALLRQQDFLHDDTLLYRTLKKELFA